MNDLTTVKSIPVSMGVKWYWKAWKEAKGARFAILLLSVLVVLPVWLIQKFAPFLVLEIFAHFLTWTASLALLSLFYGWKKEFTLSKARFSGLLVDPFNRKLLVLGAGILTALTYLTISISPTETSADSSLDLITAGAIKAFHNFIHLFTGL